VEELEGIVRSGVGGYSYDARIDGFMKRLDEIGTTAAKAASRVEQLWQKQTHKMREANKRIGELELWLGTKKYAPEDNLASKTWTKLEQLTNRLERLEART